MMAMNSSQNGSGHSKESLSHESSDMYRNASPPLMAPPQPMYYPPGMGYPSHGPHQGYPPGYSPYPNEYSQPQGYYQAGPYYNNPPSYQNANAGKAFVRGFILCSCLIFTGLFVTTIAMALLLHPQLPVYIVDSFTVANFNTTPTLTADWNINITIENNNKRLTGLFSDFKLELLHNYDVIATGTIPPFQLDKAQNEEFPTKPSSNGLQITKSTVDEIANQRANGSVTLALRLSSMVSFRSSSISTRNTLVLGICDNLKLLFQNNTGNARWENEATSGSCQLYM